MDFDATHNIEVLTVSTNSTPGVPGKSVVPLQIDLAKYPMFSRDERNKLRRPVRPIDRQRMRPWLMELLDLGNVFGLRWTNRHQGIFQISWRHASRLGWNLETDGDVFERWARHTGIYKEGDPPEPKRWKANFRCALHSLHDVVELTNAVERRGRNACRTYRFLQSNDEQSINRKRAKTRRVKELQEQLLQKKYTKGTSPIIRESGSNEDILSDTESETSHQEKVIVEKLEIKAEDVGEEFCLHHDHDYAGPDKTQKTIVLRHGIGSIVLHKEVQSLSDKADESENLLSNLNQLASAAMNSAGIDSVQLEESERDSTGMKAGSISKLAVQTPEALLANDLELKQSDFCVNHYFFDNNDLNDGCNSTKKRKLLTIFDQPISINIAGSESVVSQSEHKKTALCACPQKEGHLELSHNPSHTRQRTGSPKIFCRRSKRSGEKGEKSMSELTEPLMSSCLLLLEAATRLDNAEKTGKPTLSLKPSTSKINCTVVPKAPFYELQDMENLKHKASLTTQANIQTGAQAPSQSLKLHCEIQVHDINSTKSNNNKTPFEHVRTTLVSTNKLTTPEDSPLKSETQKIISIKSSKSEVISAISISNNNNSFQNTFAKGLFSGSNIHSESSFSQDRKKLEKDKRSLTSFKNKLLDNEHGAFKHESVTVSKSNTDAGHIFSEASLSKTCFMSVMKPSNDTEQVIEKAVTALNTSSRFDTLNINSHSNQLPTSENINSLVPSSQVQFSNGKYVVFTSETQNQYEDLKSLGLSIRSPSSQIKLLDKLHSSETLLVVDKSSHGTPLYPISGLTTSTAPGTTTDASCLPTLSFASGIQLLNTTPIYSQADSTVSKSESISLPLKTEGENIKHAAILPTELFTSSSTISSDEIVMLSTQEKDIFTIEPPKNFDDKIKYHVVALPSYFTLDKMQTEIENAIPTVGYMDKISLIDPIVLDESKDTDIHFSSCSSLPTILQTLPCQSTSTNQITKVDADPVVPVIIKRKGSAVDGGDMSKVILPETPPTERKSDFSEFVMKVGCGKTTPVHVLTDISSHCTTHQIENLSYPHDNTMAVQNCTDDSSQDHISLDFQQTVHSCKVPSHKEEIEESLSLSHSDESSSVKSLSELCKRHLSNFFLTLDHQTSESDENDSVSETPKLELKDNASSEFCSKNKLNAVILLKLHCLKCETLSENCEKKFEHSNCNVSSIPKEDSSMALSSNNFEVHSESSTTTKGSVSSISDTVDNVLDPLPKGTTSLENVQNVEQHKLRCKITPAEFSCETNVHNLSSPAVIDESQMEYSCRLTMDPTAPISIGEIPLFANSKSDSDTQTLISD